MKNFQFIEKLLEEAERSHTDIAPEYSQYLCLAFALVQEMGEDGRQTFHRFCRLSTKYNEKEADRKFTDCLSRNRGEVTLGSIIHLCRQHGIDTDAVRDSLIREGGADSSGSQVTEVTGITLPSDSAEEETGLQPPEMTTSVEPEKPLPTFGELDLPYPLDLIYKRGQTQAQCDAMLLSAMTVIGAMMDYHLRTKYGSVYQYPCMQLFIIAPSASGKGAITKCRLLADPLHEERLARQGTRDAMYTLALADWKEKVKNKELAEKPEKPPLELFIIPGNNTGTGILQNIIESRGNGIIFEVEADTVSTAIKGDYGHWSDTLRKAFDHDRLSCNRRTEREYREIKSVRLGVVISGTPQQIPPLIPSSENGLFSRHIFYYLPQGDEWIDQFEEEDGTVVDYNTYFNSLATQFMGVLHSIYDKGIIELRLTREQKDFFNRQFDCLYHQGRAVFSGELDSTVKRQAVNAVRLMSILALLREYQLHGGNSLTSAMLDTVNPYGGREPLWYLSITDEDFHSVMSIMEKLYYHSIHILSFIKSSETQRRVLSGSLLILKEMATVFTWKEWMDTCLSNGIKKGTAKGWISNLKSKKVIAPTGNHAEYRKLYVNNSPE